MNPPSNYFAILKFGDHFTATRILAAKLQEVEEDTPLGTLVFSLEAAKEYQSYIELTYKFKQMKGKTNGKSRRKPS